MLAKTLGEELAETLVVPWAAALALVWAAALVEARAGAWALGWVEAWVWGSVEARGLIDLLHKKIRGRRAPVSRRQKSRQRRLGRKNERSSTPIRVSFRGLRRYLPARRMP